MNIVWKYLDKRSATIAAVKDLDAMKFIIEHTEDDVKKAQEKMTALRSPGWDGMPHAHNPQAGEERLVKAIDEIDVLKERYRQAVEYMEWFQPAWDELSEDDRYLLETFYLDDGGYAAETIADHFCVDTSTAYRKKNRALDRLMLLLFGKQ